VVYESTPEKMKEYPGDAKGPFHFMADPDSTSCKKVLRTTIEA